MLNEKIKSLRKQKGFTQEVLAIRLSVVRQTISKWEKGLSVPDADMIIKLADLFELNTSDLLGEVSKIDNVEWTDIGEQLSRINEYLAIKNSRSQKLWKIIGIILVVIVTAQILPQWNEIWYDFGHNLYNIKEHSFE